MSAPPRTRHIRPLALLAVAALLLFGWLQQAASASPGAGAAPAAATATFTDDFNGAAGSAVDSSKWGYETGDNVNNHEREYYTSGTHNAALDGQGDLVITARQDNPSNYQCWYGTCQYTSARLSTPQKFTQAYGHFETRMKLPRGQGMWPAFWLLGDDIGSVGWPNSGEIDIMENVGFEPGSVHGTIHGPGYSGSDGIGAGYTLPGGQSFSDAFHTFAVDWAPNSISWSVDGQRLRDPHPRRPRRQPLGLRPPLLHHPQPRGRRLLARRPRRQHLLPAAARRRLRARDHQRLGRHDRRHRRRPGPPHHGPCGQVCGCGGCEFDRWGRGAVVRLQWDVGAGLDGGFGRFAGCAGQVHGCGVGRYGGRFAGAVVRLQRYECAEVDGQ